MTSPRPELIFVAGPQQGERGLLMSEAVHVGRHPGCEVHVVEKSVSRRQMRIERTADGWMATNLSGNPIRVNGKKYKAAKRILLETGDVVTVGRQTEILFISPGDDPEQALAVYRDAHPEAVAPPQPPSAEPRAQGPEPAEVQPPAPAPKEPAATETKAARPDRPRWSKRRKYVIAGVIYAAVLTALGVFLATRSQKTSEDPRAALRKLTRQKIDASISEPFRMPEHPGEAAAALREAVNLFDRRERTGNLYRAIKHFKLHLAFRGGKGFEKTEHDTMFLEARNLLVEQVASTYEEAWRREKARQWTQALALYRQLIEMTPVMEDPHPEKDNVIYRNVWQHVRHVRRRVKKRRR